MGITQLGSLAQAAAHFAAVNIDLHHIEHAVIVEACKMVQKAAKEVMGTDGYNWAALSQIRRRRCPACCWRAES